MSSGQLRLVRLPERVGGRAEPRGSMDGLGLQFPFSTTESVRAAALVFDLDGTLVDSEPYHVRAFRGAMRELAGYELTDEDVREFSGNTSAALSAALRDRHGLQLVPEAVAARKFELLYRDFRTEVFPGAGEFVRACAGTVPLAVASNSPGHFVRRALTEAGLASFFAVVTSIDDVAGRKKPDPALFLLVSRLLNVRPEDMLVFEDSSAGIDGALAAGCRVIAMRHPGVELSEGIPGDVPVRTWAELNLDMCCLNGGTGNPEMRH